MLGLLLCGLVWCCPGRADGATFEVIAADQKFTPNDLTVQVGDTVIFRMQNGGHTVTPDTGTSEPFCGTTFKFPGDSCTNTFTKAGTFAYYCQVHTINNMKGVVRVVTAANNVLPVISLLYPTNGVIIPTTPTNFFRAEATDADGTVARVEFFFRLDSLAQVVSLGVVTNQTNNIFTLASTNIFPALANMEMLAKATDNRGGEKTTSPATVFSAGPLLTNAAFVNEQFQFAFFASNGQQFVLEGSVNLTNWIPILTNTAGPGGAVLIDPGSATNILRFYRVLIAP